MNYRGYITEVTLGGNPELNKLFSNALRQVFNSSYLSKIDNFIKREIQIKEVEEKPGVVAYSQGKNIYVNTNEFYEASKEAQVRYLLHEFIHILQRYRGMLTRKFKEMKKLTNDLRKVIKKNSKYPLSVFLTGQNQDLGPGGKYEIIAYFMNDKINWNAITPQGKKEVIETLRDSKIFNLSHKFWQKRLA